MKKEKTEISARLPFAASMLIFGTIGLLRRFIELPSGVIACFRGLLGCVLLLLLQRLRGKKPDGASIRRYLLPLLASGGMIGVGAGKGWLSNLPAADTDIVFGMLCEEWGLVIAVLTILCIITLAVFAVRACRAGRSSFYTIAACAATSLLVFQTCLNIFGAVDILPFTGVTLPFVSNGGSSMLSAWGMLAFLKATDTRQNASFAVRLPSRRELRGEE